MDRLLPNIRLGIRSLRRTPGFALTAIVTLALGIGLATAVFTVADALLLRRLPVRDQDRVVVLWGGRRDQTFTYPLGIDDAREFARRARSLERVAFSAYEGSWPTPIRDGDRIYRLRGALVSGEFFGVLGVAPVLGRALRPADDVWGAAPVVVLSYGAWQRRFGGDPHVLGRQIVTYTDNVTHTIVGVIPQGLEYPRGTEVWAPIMRAIPPKSLSFGAVYLIGGLARVREIAVRSALGAGRGQVVRQLLGENGLLAALGGALGVVVAAAAVRLFVAFAPPGVPRLDEIHVNAAALAGAVGITGLAMLLFALAPAVITSRVDLERVLRSDTRQSTGRRARLAREVLVAGQVGLALIVLSAAGLIVRSLINLERVDLSFESSHLLIADLTMQGDLYGDAKEQRAMLERLVPELQALPDVRAASPVVAAPFSGNGGWDGRPAADGQSPEQAGINPMVNMEVATPDYFRTLRVPIIRGRGFTDADREGAPGAVIVSQSTARLYWPAADPIGKRLRMGEKLDQVFTVVGVVPDTRYRDLRDARPSIYFPLRQSFFPFAPWTLAIRTTGSPADVVPAIRRVITGTAPGVALVSAAPFGDFLDGPLAQPRLNALLLAVFAGAAVALAAVGLFGAMATMVRQRTRELGVRMAMGATAWDLRRLVMGRGLLIAGVGSVPGLVGALLANRLLVTLLYGVTATDLATLTAVTGFLLGVALLASLVPARATARIDAVVALRTE